MQKEPEINTTIHVSALDNAVTHEQLHSHFSQVGLVKEVLLRSSKLCPSKQYGFVMFHNQDDARKAIFKLNYSSILGKQCRLASYNPIRTERYKTGNMVLTNLAYATTEKDIHTALSKYGNILSIRISAKEPKAFVDFEQDEDASIAAQAFNDVKFCGNFISTRYTGTSKEALEIDISNLDKGFGIKALAGLLSRYGELQSCQIHTNPGGEAIGTASAIFETMNEAQTAINGLNGLKLGIKKIQVAWKNSSLIHQPNKSGRENTLYVKNLESFISSTHLKDLFSPYGQITECKVIYHPEGESKGFGFVTFNNHDDAESAIIHLKGYQLGRKNILVSFYKKTQSKIKKEKHFKRFINKPEHHTERCESKHSFYSNNKNKSRDEKSSNTSTESASASSPSLDSLDSSIKSLNTPSLSPIEDKERMTSMINDVKNIAYSLASIITKIP
ncbi:hypothetical protein DSO57_1002698 [Entomophthora muscae]|uniref:Uncharacterized protein n=1 Tax=Entomophthora muscae TaxID=34485 RepID=A0ACC2UII2_9FUNG|nr:hypothetical protein DSO57_1002698 [Entomophthora muscae]